MHGLNHEKLLHAAVGVNVEVPETPVRKPAVPQLEGEGEGGGGEGEGGEGDGDGGDSDGDGGEYGPKTWALQITGVFEAGALDGPCSLTPLNTDVPALCPMKQ